MCRYQECNTRLTHCYNVSTYMLLLLLVMSNLLFVGNPYWFSLLRLQRANVKLMNNISDMLLTTASEEVHKCL